MTIHDCLNVALRYFKHILYDNAAFFILNNIDTELGKLNFIILRLFFKFFVQVFKIGQNTVCIYNICRVPSIMVYWNNLGIKIQLMFKLLQILYLT